MEGRTGLKLIWAALFNLHTNIQKTSIPSPDAALDAMPEICRMMTTDYGDSNKEKGQWAGKVRKKERNEGGTKAANLLRVICILYSAVALLVLRSFVHTYVEAAI